MAPSDPNTILLVEDSAADTYLMQRAVADCGPALRLWIMPDGPEALMFLRKEPPLEAVPTPALIILDLGLPMLSGRELLPAIRGLPEHRATPIVVLSATAREEAEGQCLELGATEYVQKVGQFAVYFNALKRLIWRWLPAAGE